MVKIENPSRKDFDSIMQFLEESFDHSRRFFYQNYPQTMSRDTLDYDNFFIIRQNKRIASLVGIFEQKIVLDGRKTKIGGIGSVSTHPDFRNKGFMRILMDFCVDEMKRRNYSFSILGGDRQRYNFWGYETCGTNVVITFTQRSFEKSGITETIPVFRYNGSTEILERIKSQYEKFPCHVERTINWLKKAFDERVHTQLYYTETKKDFAYAVAVGERIERRIVEIGGSEKLWNVLLYSLLKRWNSSSVNVFFPGNIPQTNLMIEHANWFRIEPFFMIKILSFKQLLEFLFGNGLPGGYVLKVKETKEVAGKGEKIIEFDEKKWVRILFGPSLTEAPEFMKRILPSKFYWWYLDHI